MEEGDKLKQGVNAARILTLSSLLLSILKLVVGLLTNSIILISDGIHSGSDLITALASLLGLKIAQKKKNERFPYGYYKAENLSAFLIALLIIYGAIRLIIEGIAQVKNPSTISMPMLAMATALIAVITSFFVSKHTIKIGNKIKSQSLIANGKERMLDVISASLVFITIFLSYYFNLNYLNGITTIIISLFILKVGLETARESTLALMDYNPTKGEKIIKWLNQRGEKEKIKFDNLKIRQAGPFLLAEVDAQISGTNIKKTYEIINELREETMKKFDLTSMEVFIKPTEKKTVTVVIPTNNNENISEHFARAEKFKVFKVNTKTKKILEEDEIKNPYIKKAIRAGMSTAKFLMDKSIDYVLTKEIGEISLHILMDNSIIVLKTNRENVRETLEDFLNKKLKLIKKATRIKD